MLACILQKAKDSTQLDKGMSKYDSKYQVPPSRMAHCMKIKEVAMSTTICFLTLNKLPNVTVPQLPHWSRGKQYSWSPSERK